MAEKTARTREEDGEGFTAEERAAMKDRAKEVRRGRKKDGTADLLEKVAEMEGTEREMAERLHALITEAAPELEPKTWYGMPAYAKDGKVLCFFQPAAKFNARYSTFGFNDVAALDDGEIWPTSFAITELTASAEERIVALVRRAVG
ncbi:iron chaperone [Agromyces sp. SYSU T0242]|uniref:iron chaperone n=1 Tax=Agromyces litoreus TaxID=3158561 RepID=UPI0033920465